MRTCDRCTMRAPLCDACLDHAFDYTAGPAGARGLAWANRVAAELGLPFVGGERRAWPPFEGKAETIARRLVANLAGGDERLHDRLARQCHLEAARWWARKPG